MNVTRWFIAIVACQVAFLPLEVAHYERALRSGKQVLLRVVPVDPRSLFMGNYMDLSYDITTIDLAKVAHQEPVKNFAEATTVYIALDTTKRYATAQEIATTRALLKHQDTVIRGQNWSWSSIGSVPKELRVNYGAERYFIPESKQEEVNRLTWQRGNRAPEIGVEISLQPDGQALLRRVLVDGKTVGY